MGSLQWWVGAGVVLGVIATAVALTVTIGKPLRRLARQNDEFREDWYGQPARPGRDRVPGVPERLSNIEHQQTSNGDGLAHLTTRFEDHIKTHGGM